MTRQDKYLLQRKGNMQNWSYSKMGLRRMAIAGVLAGMLMILGCGGGRVSRRR